KWRDGRVGPGRCQHPHALQKPLDIRSIVLYPSNHENHSAPAPGPIGGRRKPCRGLQGPRSPHPPAGLLLPGPRRTGSLGGRDPGGRGSPGADPVAPPRPAPAGRARGESQGRAVHLLFRAAGDGDHTGAPAHRLLLKGDSMSSAKVHLHMHVSDLGKSRDFYERFLGEGPVKVKTGYVKFVPAWAPVNLAVSEGGLAAVGTVNHVGVQLETVDAVMAQLARVKSAGLPVREEMGVNCCHANQDKFWVQDPDGVEWEVYHLNYDLEDEVTGDAKPAAKGLQLAKSNSCCA